MKCPLLPLPAGIAFLACATVSFARPVAGRASVSAEGPRGGSYDASAAHVGRFGTASVNAEGPRGATYDATANRAGRYRGTSVNAEGVHGGSVSASSSTWSGYRSGFVYSGGTYHSANVVVNKAYVAPVGAYAGWTVVAVPAYVAYPQFATYPVEVAVQVQLKQLGYYGGEIDGQIGLGTQKAIAKYQAAEGLAVTGTITQAVVKSLHIS
jgi:peptidoglycan hydrolase-like protein with peptidoglycan-binding domain